MPNKIEFTRFECECSLMEHNVRFSLDPEDGQIFVDTVLRASHPWYKRLIIAIKYILQPNKSNYGFHEEVILKKEDYSKIRDLLDKSEAINK